MNNKKLNLNELKVQSFVTALKSENENTVKGGTAENGCIRPTAQHDMTCGSGCSPTDMSCGIPCGPDDLPTNYC